MVFGSTTLWRDAVDDPSRRRYVVKLAKLALDVGLYTNQRDAMLEFWQSDAGVTFDELLPVGRGVHQLRHRIGDSILKINHARSYNFG